MGTIVIGSVETSIPAIRNYLFYKRSVRQFFFVMAGTESGLCPTVILAVLKYGGPIS